MSSKNIKIRIRRLEESDLSSADRMFRLAFGTFLGIPDPMVFYGDADLVKNRYLADPTSTLAAESPNGELIGFNFAINWGSIGYFGPLVVHPDYWDQGIAKQLLLPTMNIFDKKWHTKLVGLFTFAHSTKHVGLYQKFGFWPRFLTMIMSKPAWSVDNDEQQTKNDSRNLPYSLSWSKFSEIPSNKREQILAKCRLLTNSVYDGLDLRHEILAVNNQMLGDTILLHATEKNNVANKDNDDDVNSLAGLAVCHCGAGSEAGSGVCYIKFGLAISSDNNSKKQNFKNLLNAASLLAKERHLSRIVAGINTERSEAYSHMVEEGFRTEFQGVVMHRPNESGYNRSYVYLIDDWR
jgi:ribosomal protein S18 acetylase RimI-like enzyme